MNWAYIYSKSDVLRGILYPLCGQSQVVNEFEKFDDGKIEENEIYGTST